jgi:hypothetical protein
MKMRWLIGLLIGGIVGLIANVALGFVCGLLIGAVTDQINSGPIVRESALMLAWIFPSVLLGTCGPALGAVVGLISSYLRSWHTVAFVAVLVGLGQSFLIFLQLLAPATPVLITYILLAVVSMLAAGLATCYVVSRLQRSNARVSDLV